SVPRIHIYRKIKKKTLAAKYTTGSRDCPSGGRNESCGPCHPPKNSSVAKHATVNMCTYSAIKNMANFIELYSVWYPATSSVSASGISNGMRLVSAYAA